ncbi:MAG: hypothetical protein ROY99_04930 [Ignavibacterium sp.]|jgi:hypothetical protein|nr:hypothetical protein [Ignavibacterium sp.]
MLKINYLFLSLFLIALFVLTISCNTTEPTDNIKPGRRDYTWKVDTLDIPFTTLQRIWGSSPDDVWAIGPGGDKDKTIYHFDGKKWKTDGISRPLAPTSIFGFAPDNVWIGGRGGEIWHFNGFNLSKIFTMNITGYNFYGFENIWGDAINNVYAVGYAEDGVTYKGIIALYDGVTWENLDIPIIKNSFIKIQRGIKSNNNYFILAYRFEQFAEDTSYIYEFDGLNLNKIYQGITTTQELAELACINGKIYIREGYNIFEYNNKKLDLLFKLPAEASISGRNIKDIFLAKIDGIAHYNGSDIQYLYHFGNNISLSGEVIFDNEIFFLAYDFNNSLNLVFRGKLK